MQKRFKYGVNATIVTVCVIVGVILVNMIFGVLSDKMSLKIDLTQDRIYELSDQTKDIMKNLSQPVDIVAFYPDTEAEVILQVKEYLSRYQALSSNVHVQYVDPLANPEVANQYKGKGDTVDAGSIVVKNGDVYKVISLNSMYTEQNINVERNITSAIMYVTGSLGEAKIYFTQGHNEFENTPLESVLRKENYTVEKVNLTLGDVPQDAQVVVISALQSDFTGDEIEKIDKYLQRGGNLMVTYMPFTTDTPRLDAYVAEWGIKINNDYVIEGDKNKSYTDSSRIIAAPDMQQSPITEKLIGSGKVFLAPSSRSMDLNAQNAQNAVVTSLLKTTANSWGKINKDAASPDKEAGDTEGPFTLASIASRIEGTKANVMVFGSVEALLYVDTTYANEDFVLNTVAYLTDKQDNLAIRPKAISMAEMAMTESQKSGVTIVIFALPLLIIALGLFIWIRRRHL